MKDTKKDYKDTWEFTGRILKEGTAGYQAERNNIIAGLAKHGSPGCKKMLEENMFAKDEHCKANEQDLKNSCSYDF